MRRKLFLKRMHAILVKRREHLVKSLDRDLRQLTETDVFGVGDMGDAAIDAERDGIYSQIAAAESNELGQIDDALTRMLDGRYGVCENCGTAIPEARLQALP